MVPVPLLLMLAPCISQPLSLYTDDYTRMTRLYVLKNKSDVSTIFRSFAQMIQTQYSSVIKVLRSDNGGEYINFELSEFLSEQGILHETICLHTPQQNGVAELKIATFWKQLVLCSLGPWFLSVFGLKLLPMPCMSLIAYPIGWLVFKHLFKSSHNMLQWYQVMLSPLESLVVVTYVHIQKIHRSKLDPCALQCVFLGFSSH